MRSFAELPSEIERRLGEHRRVVVVLLDAFGRRFLHRYGDDHPFLRRMAAEGEVHEIATQFPSTTAAHVTTMHTGQPVQRHGIYEWNVLEPSLGRIVTPLRFSFAGDRETGTLAGSGVEIADLLPPEPTFYERLRDERGVGSTVFQPGHFSPSTYDSGAVRGADLRPYADFGAALAEAAGVEGYAYVYLDAIDATGHVCGPSSSEFDQTVRWALDAVEAAVGGMRDTLLVVTADHGQVDVDPARTLWLDELWTGLPDRLALRPAGSARDVFLHVRPGCVDEVVEVLRDVVGDMAEVHPVASLLDEGAFGPDPGPRLRERLADVCVLPAPDRMAWLRSAPDMQQRFRGHHGGRAEDEARTWAGFLSL